MKKYKNLSVDEVRDLINKKLDKNFILVDVRQPHEYKKSHIPGAVLVPLGNLESQLENLPRDKDLVFYCHSGRRSSAAALLAGTSGLFSPDKVMNMQGGILEWGGIKLQGVPDLRSFDFTGSTTQNLLQAMELEKGADRFYSIILGQINKEEVMEKIDLLAKAEEAHARKLYGAIPIRDGDMDSFEKVYLKLEGKIVEGGKDIDLLLDYIDTSGLEACQASLELALTIECTAYDMYRNLAEYCTDIELEELFLEIAQSEKTHITIAAEALAMCSE